VWEERNVFSSELRQALRDLVGERVCHHVYGVDDITHAEPPPPVDANPLADEASAAKRSKLDLSPPATPPKRPAPEVSTPS